jgi:hypothetical protein
MNTKLIFSLCLSAVLSTAAYANGDDKIDKSVSGEKNTHTKSDNTSTVDSKGNQKIIFHDKVHVDGVHDRSSTKQEKNSKYDD